MNEPFHFQLHTQGVKSYLLHHKCTVCLCLISVFFWGLLAHGYGFAHNNLSHDVLNAFVATPTENAWKIELGRFLVPLYRTVFRGSLSLPWLIGFLGLLWTAAAVFLTVNLLQLRSKVAIVLVAGIMVSNITNIAQIATYLYEFDCNCFALLLSVLAAYLPYRKKGVSAVLAGGICAMASVAIYQAYFAVTLTWIVGSAFLTLLGEEDVRAVLCRALRGLGATVLGLVLYLLLGALVCSITGIALQSRTNALDLGGENPIVFYLRLVVPSMQYLGENLLHTAYRSGIFVISVLSLTLLLAGSVLRLVMIQKIGRGRVLLLLLSVAALPFTMTSACFLAKGSGLHDLMNYAFWFFYILMLALSFRLCHKDMQPTRFSMLLRGAVCLLIGVILWQNVILANTAYVKKELESAATRSTMTRVLSMLEQRNYLDETPPVAFIGVHENTIPTEDLMRVSAIVGLESSSAIPYDTSLPHYNAYRTYFTYVLPYPIRFCADEVHAQLKDDPRVQLLPTFPHAGCMEMIDGTLVIKMGE